MTIIKWRDGYNTGVAQFDQEHHKLVELIDVMYRAIRDKKGKEVTENVIGELINYTDYHFNNEERAMAVANFPELEEHKTEHARLKQEVQKLQCAGNAHLVRAGGGGWPQPMDRIGRYMSQIRRL